MRVPQAASNNVTEVDQKDVDAMLNISYLTGHSDSRYATHFGHGLHLLLYFVYGSIISSGETYQ